MKVICANCGELEDENEAISLSQKEYDYLGGSKLGLDFIYTFDHESFLIKSTQICSKCFKKPRWH